MTGSPDPRPIRLGILAGGGSLPAELEDAAVGRGWPVHIVAIDGEADLPLTAVSSYTRVNWGQIGGMLRAFREHGATHLAIAGRVRRPDLTRLRPDMGLVWAIPAILRIVRAGGDDGVLRRVIRFFEDHGLTVLGPLDIAPGLAVPRGPLGQRAPDEAALRDIAKGMKVVRALGAFDIGQGVVVRDEEVIAIEGAEGTDAMLARIDTPGIGRRGVFVKRPKPLQDMRVDVPTIGPETVRNAARAGLAGVAVLAGQVLVMQREDVIGCANADQVFVAGVTDETGDAATPPPAGPASDAEDIRRGSAIMAALRPHRDSRIVVVARKYVLAVEAGEGAEAVLERVGGLRQWGGQRVKKRSGTAVFSARETVEAHHVDLAARSGLRGLAVLPGGTVTAVARQRAAELRLAIAEAPAEVENGA
jgi:DUF1009 family protein